jgi:hypothetical protein
MKHVLIAGTDGAYFNYVSRHLHGKNWSIVWLKQDVDIFDGRRLLNSNGQNIEVLNLIYNFCEQNNVSVWSDSLPEFFDLPYPGPAEFLAKFDKPAIVCSLHMTAFLNLWVGHIDTVIDIQATEEEDLTSLQSWNNELTPDYVKGLRKHRLERYYKHLKLFKNVFTMTNAEVKQKQFEKLDAFLSSVT